MKVTCRGMTGDLINLSSERKRVNATWDKYAYVYQIDLYNSETRTTYSIESVGEEEMVFHFDEE